MAADETIHDSVNFFDDETSTTKSLHARVSNVLRDMIYKRELAPGQKIPSEHEMMSQFGVSRGTVRRAIKTLVDEGMLVQEHGRGTFVVERALSHPAGVRPLSFAESLRQQGKEFKTNIIASFLDVASEEVACQLEIAVGAPVFFLRRVRTVNGEPIMCQEGWYPLEVCPNINEFDFEQGSAFEAVQQYAGSYIKYSRMSYMARVAGREHGMYLQCEETAPVLLLEQQIRLEDGRPAEWSYTWLPAGQKIIGNATQPL